VNTLYRYQTKLRGVEKEYDGKCIEGAVRNLSTALSIIAVAFMMA
jgi:hypothetical protein